MADERLDRLWQVLDSRRGSRQLSLEDALRAAHEAGLRLTYDEVRTLLRRLPGDETALATPPMLSDFVTACANRFEASTILDPWAGLGALIGPVVASCDPTRAVAVARRAETPQLVKAIDAPRLEWLIGDPLRTLPELQGTFDLVASALPFGYRLREPVELEFATGRHSERDLGLALIAKSLSLLAGDGLALFCVPPSFFHRRPGQRFRQWLREAGYRLHAALWCAPDTFAPITPMASYMVAIRPMPASDVFVARLAADSGVDRLLERWLRRQSAPDVSGGAFVAEEEFPGFERLITTAEINRLAARAGLKRRALAEVTSAINGPRRSSKGGGFENLPGSVYLPLLGTGDATTSIAAMSVKPQHVAQIVPDPGQVDPEFLALMWNSELGRLQRADLTPGASIARISLGRLRESCVYIPTLQQQREAVQLARRLDTSIDRLVRVRGNVVLSSRDLQPLRIETRGLLKEGSDLEWLERLPFPLASILRRVAASRDTRARKDHAFHFFEALAQFLIMVLLSGYFADQTLWRTVRDDLLSDEDRDALRRSSFGMHVVLLAKLAKQVRQDLSSDPERRTQLLTAFSQGDRAFLDVLSEKSLVNALLAASEKRNEWKGHSGVESGAEGKRRLEWLLEAIRGFEDALLRLFDESRLVIACSADFRDGAFETLVRSAVGSSPVFTEEMVVTSEPLESGALFLVRRDAGNALQLLPFVRFGPVPSAERAACYFLNRIDASGARWVSYHFEEAAEVRDDGQAVREVLAALQPGADS